jgi:hypothetical protein
MRVNGTRDTRKTTRTSQRDYTRERLADAQMMLHANNNNK